MSRLGFETSTSRIQYNSRELPLDHNIRCEMWHCIIWQIHFNIVARRSVSRQRVGKHVPAPMDTHATTAVLLEMVFSTRSVQRDYKEGS
jgi:hypothetical protein